MAAQERENRRKLVEETGKKWNEQEENERLREEIEKKDKIRASLQEKRKMEELSRKEHPESEL